MIPKTNTRYKWYVLFALTLVYTFNFIDRQILVILQEPIKAELALSDTQLGLLTGLAFAAIYVILGIPIARLADMGNRKNIVVISLGFWSAMTVLSGMTKSFLQLLLARFGVGVGEAGGSPPAHSIISDYFPPEKRSTALSIYSSGVYLGILMGFVIGGIVAKLYGWRIAFYSLGIPGILFAIIIYFTIKEPLKGQTDKAGLVKETPSLGIVLKTLFSKRSFLFLALATGFHNFAGYGVLNFLPAFLQRVHQVDIATAGIILGLGVGLGGIIGTFLGGHLTDRFGVRDMRWYLWVPMIAISIGYIPSIILFFGTNASVAKLMPFFVTALASIHLGPAVAVSHSLVNAKMRSFASAILFFILNIIGLGCGPLIVGAISDYLMPQLGADSLRWAFSSTLVTSFIAICFYFLATRHYITDLKTTDH